MIELVLVGSKTKTKRYQTIAKAREMARRWLGENPKIDPDGYAVNRTNGDCLFVQGAELEDVVL